MDAGEILDGAFSLYRRHRGAFVPAGGPAVWAGPAVDAFARVVRWLAVCQAAGVPTPPLGAAARTLRFDPLRVRAQALDRRVLADRLAAA